jgi:hypothetical protein
MKGFAKTPAKEIWEMKETAGDLHEIVPLHPVKNVSEKCLILTL